MFPRMATVQFGIPRGGDVKTTTPDVELLQRRLIATSAALQGARAAVVHCPSADNEQAVATAQRRLDQLLDQLIDQRMGTT